MKEQQELGIKESSSADRTSVGDYKFEPIRGQPMLRWAGKRPFTSTQFFPAQEKERHGDDRNCRLGRDVREYTGAAGGLFFARDPCSTFLSGVDSVVWC